MTFFLRTYRERVMTQIVNSTLMAMFALASAAAPALASTSPPVKDHAWGACQLSSTLRTQLNSAIKSASGNKFTSVSVDFIVVHSIASDNNGQPIIPAAGGGNSGVILCTFNGTSKAATTFETTVIPNGSDQPNADKIDILTNQQQSVLQYELKYPLPPNKIEKRVCQTTDRNTDCFRVFKQP